MTESTASQVLTAPQRRCLDFVRSFIERHGYAPSLREISDGLGWAATNAAADMLGRLQAKGYLERAKGRARAIRLTDPSSAANPGGGCGPADPTDARA